jgi:hypothetical protein
MALKPLRLSWLYSGAFGNILNSLLSIGNGENSFHCSSIPVYPKSLSILNLIESYYLSSHYQYISSQLQHDLTDNILLYEHSLHLRR